MLPITFDPLLAAAVWKLTGTIRGAIPASWVNIDGKWRVWALVALTTAVALYLQATATGHLPTTTALWIHFALEGVVTGFFAVVIDGGAAAAGLKDTVRVVDTLGGLTNPLPTATEGAIAQAVVAQLPAGLRRPAQEVIDDFKMLTSSVLEAQLIARQIQVVTGSTGVTFTAGTTSTVPPAGPEDPAAAPVVIDPPPAGPAQPLALIPTTLPVNS